MVDLIEPKRESNWGLLWAVVIICALLVLGCAAFAGESPLDAGPGSVPPATVVTTTQKATTINVQPPAVTINQQPIHVYPPDVTADVKVEAQKTDWYALLTQLAGAVGLLTVAARKVSQHFAAGTAKDDWNGFIAYGLQWAKGDGPQRLANALEIARERYRKATGEDMSNDDLMKAENSIAALHAASDGLVVHDPNAELEQKRAEVAAMAKKLGMTLTGLVLLLVCGGCTFGVGRPQSLITAEAKLVARYEADHANLKTVANAYDQALLTAQTNFATELHNERISQITAAVAANPALAADGIAAAADANLKLNTQLAAQNAAQDAIRKIVIQSEATNIAQARQLDMAIRKYDSTAPFNAAAAATSIATTVQGLIPQPSAIVTPKAKAVAVPPAPATVIP